MEHFDFSKLERKVFPTEEEKIKRASNFDYGVASSALEGYEVGEEYLLFRQPYIDGYLTAQEMARLNAERLGLVYTED